METPTTDNYIYQILSSQSNLAMNLDKFYAEPPSCIIEQVALRCLVCAGVRGAELEIPQFKSIPMLTAHHPQTVCSVN